MSTVRIQIRRGTAAQWTSANPTLAAGEMGVESDTRKTKIGTGSTAWTSLAYANVVPSDLTNTLGDYLEVADRGVANGVASLDAQGQVPINQLGNVIDAAPGVLDTLNELAAAINDDANFVTTMNTSINTRLPKSGGTMTGAIAMGNSKITGLATPTLDYDASTKKYVDDIQTQTVAGIATHGQVSTNVHGVADMTALATMNYVNTEITAHNNDTTSVHGIADTSVLANQTYVTGAVAAEATARGAAITAEATARAAAITAAATTAATNLDTHTADTTSVHGISDTSALALTATVNSGLALKADLASPTFTGTVSGITKSMVGLGNVDNTADTAKPVSTAAQTELDLKAPLASPALTGVPTAPTATAGTSTTQVATTAFVGTAVSNLVASAPAVLDTLNELATALGNDASFSTTITNSIATKSPIASPTFTGTVTAPAITATGLITASASGVAFTDGTQTKEGVASRTPIVQKTASYTLSALTERDSLIEVSSATAVTITIPTNTAVAYPIGTSIDILQTGAGQVTIAPVDGTVTVNATPGLKLRTTWSSATLFKRAANTWVVYGDLMA